MKTSLRLLSGLLLILLTGLLVGGCASPESTDNAASRPWNSPRGWESGLPSGMNEGR